MRAIEIMVSFSQLPIIEYCCLAVKHSPKHLREWQASSHVSALSDLRTSAAEQRLPLSKRDY